MYQTPPPPVLFVVALSLSLSMSGRLAVAQSDVDFVNPTDGGGSWLTLTKGPVGQKWNNWWAGGEPLNVVISARSDPRIISDLDTFLDYCSSLKFSRQCFQWEDGESLQAANLGDGNDLVNQTTILRYDYDDPIFGTCTESMQGGNHFRIFRQNGTRVASSGGGAWFLAVSKEHNLAKNHMIVPNGYDLGRDELVEIAVNPNGTRSPVSQTLYRATVRAVGGREYFGAVGPNEINHGVGIDGRIAVLTVTVAEEGNDIQLPSFVDSISSIAFHPSDPNLLLTSSWDQHVYLTNLQNPSSPRKLAVRGAILDVAWAPNSTSMAYVGGLGKEVRSVDFETQESQLIAKHDEPVKCVEYCQQLNAVVSASWDKTLKVTPVDPETRQPLESLVLSLPDKAYSLSLSPTKIVVAMGGRHVYIYDIPTLKQALDDGAKPVDAWSKRESNLKFMTRAIACMPDDTGYAMTSIEGRVAVEFFDPNPDQQAKKYAFKCHRQVIDGVDTVYPVQGLTFNPVYGTFSTGGGDSTVSLWDPFAKKRLRQFSKYPSPVSALAFSPDGKRLAIAFSEEDEGGNEHAKGGNGVWIRECGDEVKPKSK
ncbi:hypothetical protein JCM3766R1_001233 [Sporobolomyces carnicolor]